MTAAEQPLPSDRLRHPRPRRPRQAGRAGILRGGPAVRRRRPRGHGYAGAGASGPGRLVLCRPDRRRLAGINYVCARTNSQSDLVGPENDYLAGMTGGDHAADLAATREFVRACFARGVSGDTLEEIVAYNMLMPAHDRAAHLSRPAERRRDPVTDRCAGAGEPERSRSVGLKGLGALTASLVPGATLSLYGGVGHASFVEDPGRFNRELAQFAAAAHARRG